MISVWCIHQLHSKTPQHHYVQYLLWCSVFLKKVLLNAACNLMCLIMCWLHLLLQSPVHYITNTVRKLLDKTVKWHKNTQIRSCLIRTGGPALVLLIVTAADGCCCVSNGRAVFWHFCPKKHDRKSGKKENKSLIWRQMGRKSDFRKHWTRVQVLIVSSSSRSPTYWLENDDMQDCQ